MYWSDEEEVGYLDQGAIKDVCRRRELEGLPLQESPSPNIM